MSHVALNIFKQFQWPPNTPGGSVQHDCDIRGRFRAIDMEFDPHAWTRAAAELKTAFDMFRSAIGLYRDIRPGTENPEQAKAITAALDKAETAAKVAEAEIAKALGFELCKCEFPPTAMLTVGYWIIPHGRHHAGDPVYECPKRGITTAGPYNFERTAPPRDAQQAM
jgi:hypothetical protein